MNINAALEAMEIWINRLPKTLHWTLFLTGTVIALMLADLVMWSIFWAAYEGGAYFLQQYLPRLGWGRGKVLVGLIYLCALLFLFYLRFNVLWQLVVHSCERLSPDPRNASIALATIYLSAVVPLVIGCASVLWPNDWVYKALTIGNIAAVVIGCMLVLFDLSRRWELLD